MWEDAEALWQYRKQFTVWRKALIAAIVDSRVLCGQALMVSWQENERAPVPAEVRDSLELKKWSELTDVEKAGRALGATPKLL